MRYEKMHKNLKDCDNNVSIYVVSIDVVVSWLHKKRFFFLCIFLIIDLLLQFQVVRKF